MKSGISEYNSSYDKNVEVSEEIIVTHPSHLILYDETHFKLTQKGTGTNTNVDPTLHASEGGTGELLSSRHEFNCTAVV